MQTELLDEVDGLRTWAVVLDTGEEAKDALTSWASASHVSAAQLTAIGAFVSATLGWYDLEAKTYRDIDVNEQVEVLTLAGDVSLSPDGSTFLHMHAVCGRRDGSTVGGHVQRAVVRPTLEVVVTEVPQRLRRRHDSESGLALLELTAASAR
jgi:predicted DNA-binding protein with PD1-like motif